MVSQRDSAYLNRHPGYREFAVRLKNDDSLRLVLHNLRFASDSLRWVSDPDLGSQMGADFSHVSLSTERRRIREILANDDEYHWVILSRKNAVGSIFIGSIREESSRFGCRAGMLSYLLEKQYRGRGVMSSVAAAVLRWAFHEGGFGAVSARVFPDNTASMQLLGKLGFVADSTESVDAETRERFGHPAWERFLLRGDQYS